MEYASPPRSHGGFPRSQADGRCQDYGPVSEKIPGMDGLKGGDSFEFGSGNFFFFSRSMLSLSIGFNFGTKLAVAAASHALSGIVGRDDIEQASSPVEPFCLAC